MITRISLRSMAVLSSRAQERRSREIRARSARERAAKPRENSRFLCPRPPLLLSAPNQNCHATQAIHECPTRPPQQIVNVLFVCFYLSLSGKSEMKIKTLKTKSDKYKIKTEISTEKQNDEEKIKTSQTKSEKDKTKTEKQNDEVKIKTLKTKTEKYKTKTEISTEKQNDEVKIKTLQTKTEK